MLCISQIRLIKSQARIGSYTPLKRHALPPMDKSRCDLLLLLRALKWTTFGPCRP